MDYTDEQIEKATRNLSREMLEAISSSRISSKTEEIGGRYNLNENQLIELVDITTDLALALIPKNEFPKILMRLFTITETLANALSLDIDREIFQKINSVSLKQKQYKSLPSDVQEAIISVGVANKLTALTAKYKLHLDKAEELSDETSLVMLGITHPQDYMKNLRRRLELPDDLARDLVADVNEQIFKPIRESLKRIHGMSPDQQPTTPVVEGTAVSEQSSIHGTAHYGAGLQPVTTYREPITDEDTRIMANAGIEVTDNGKQITNNGGEDENDFPKRGELIEGLENTAVIKQDGVGISSGFSTVKNVPLATPIASPSEKLGATIKTPATETAYVPINNQQPTTDNNAPRYADDPYREPVQ